MYVNATDISKCYRLNKYIYTIQYINNYSFCIAAAMGFKYVGSNFLVVCFFYPQLTIVQIVFGK